MPFKSRAIESIPYRDPYNLVDEMYDVPIQVVERVEDLTISKTETMRYSILDPRYTIPIDFLLHPKINRRLIVGFHGAENPKAANHPKFQFMRTFTQRPESSLYLADSTVLQGEKMSIGWMAGNAETPLNDIMADIVRRVCVSLSIEETVLVGHSAGGFDAILTGSKVPNSRAISVNAQTVVDRYDQYTVNYLRQYAFPECASNDEMMDKYRSRLDLRDALSRRVANSTFTFFSHVKDDSSFSRLPHFPLMAEYMGLDETHGGRSAGGDALVPCDWTIDPAKNPSGHALPGTILPFLQLVLGEPTQLQTQHHVDPRWHIV